MYTLFIGAIIFAALMSLSKGTRRSIMTRYPGIKLAE